MKENIYKQARLNAAKTNPNLRSVEKTYPQLFISREKLLMIEQTDPNRRSTNPNPDEVLQMSNLYNAPELCNYYCTHHCPIGKGSPELMYNNLEQITVRLMVAMHYLEDANDGIFRILEDGKVENEEREEFTKILEILSKISYSANSLELWAQKNKFKKK